MPVTSNSVCWKQAAGRRSGATTRPGLSVPIIGWLIVAIVIIAAPTAASASVGAGQRRHAGPEPDAEERDDRDQEARAGRAAAERQPVAGVVDEVGERDRGDRPRLGLATLAVHATTPAIAIDEHRRQRQQAATADQQARARRAGAAR